jgi:hypothetical protein
LPTPRVKRRVWWNDQSLDLPLLNRVKRRRHLVGAGNFNGALGWTT